MDQKKRGGSTALTPDPFWGAKQRKRVPHEFVLDALAAVEPRTNPMFGCLAVYVGEKIVMILRDKQPKDRRGPKGKRIQKAAPADADNGIWLATTVDHHASLRRDFPYMRSVAIFGKEVTGWQVLPADAPDFEQAALRACELIAAHDPRIGKVPKKKSPRLKK
jgi:hypothetical protein